MEAAKTYQLVELILTFVTALLASSGFWMYMLKRSESKDVKVKLLKGLAHDRIITLGIAYLQKGCVSQDEYENLNDYLYKPYKELEGNGTIKKIMAEVEKLPMTESKC